MTYSKFDPHAFLRGENPTPDLSKLSKVSKVIDGPGITLDTLDSLDTTHRRNRNFEDSLKILQRKCPSHVPPERWSRAVSDGRWLLDTWGPQLEHLDWTSVDLFGLSPVPDKPHITYLRLARVDLLGLIWLLHGRSVVALTADTAAIEGASGARLTFYRRRETPLEPAS